MPTISTCGTDSLDRWAYETSSVDLSRPALPETRVYELISRILSYDVRAIQAPSQAWYWTSRWQEMEQEASGDIASGRTTRFESGEALLAHFEQIGEDPDPRES